MLEHETDLPLAHMARRGIFAIEQDLARIGLFEAGNDAQQRRLAAAGRAEQGRQFAGRKRQRDVVESDEIAKTLADVFHFNGHVQASLCKVTVDAWARHSIHVFNASVTSASKASSEATANAAAKLYSL